MGPSQISDTPFQGYVIVFLIVRWFLWNIYIYYVYINVAVSCKRYPPSLPYIIIVQTCGKRWDLPKFVEVLSVNLGFSRLLIWGVSWTWGTPKPWVSILSHGLMTWMIWEYPYFRKPPGGFPMIFSRSKEAYHCWDAIRGEFARGWPWRAVETGRGERWKHMVQIGY